MVECSSCANESDNLLGPSLPKRQGVNAASVTSTASSTSSYVEHPPLPTVSSTPKTSYIPPLPYTSNTLQDQAYRITIPKPELKISRATTAFGGHNVKTLYNSHEDIFLTDPPLPAATKVSPGKKAIIGGSQQNLLDESGGGATSRMGWRPNLGHNSFSTDYLDRFHDSFSRSPAKPPKALPRSVFPKEHMVIDVIPKPSSVQVPRSGSAIDQTLGIPLTYNPPSFHHLKHSFPTVSLYGRNTGPPMGISRADSLQSINTVAVPTVIHQYPLISGNIPAVSSSHSPKTHLLENSAIINPSTSGSSSYLRNTKDTASILALTSSAGRTQANLAAAGSAGQSAKKESGEKNKVKFSDTITVAVVPVIRQFFFVYGFGGIELLIFWFAGNPEERKIVSS